MLYTVNPLSPPLEKNGSSKKCKLQSRRQEQKIHFKSILGIVVSYNTILFYILFNSLLLYARKYIQSIFKKEWNFAYR